MRFKELFTRRSKDADSDLQPPSRAEFAGTVEEVSTLEAVFRALIYLQTIAGQLRLSAYRDVTPRDDLPIIRKPDNQMTQRAWTIANVSSLSTTGNAYWRIIRSDSAILDLRYLQPSRVGVTMNAYGRRDYSVDGRRVAADSIAHLRYLELPGRATGLGPIEAGRRGLVGQLQVSKYGDTLFTSGGVPKGLLTTDQALNEAQIEDASASWDKKQNAGKTAVLGRGLSYKYLGISPADMQWLESQKFGVAKVARLFGIPPVKLAIGIDGASMTYQNVENAALDFTRDTLMGYLGPIEDALSDLLPNGTEARYNLDAVLRPDTKTRYEAHKIGLEAGFLTEEEVRNMEKLGPKSKADDDNQ